MTPVILTDLDDTLFTTLKNYRDRDPATLRRVTTANNGNHSYLCETREAILKWVSLGATIIPVTARSQGAYDRVDMVFTEGAVLSNGAIILLPNGDVDTSWSEITRTICLTAAPIYDRISRVLAAFDPDDSIIRVLRHTHNGVMIGMTIKSNDEAEYLIKRNLHTAISLLGPVVPEGAMQMHVNGNNLAIIPPGISKMAAVQYLISVRPDLQCRPLIGAGDSLSDLPFMELCDMMLVPNRSQASARLFKKSVE